MKHYNKNPGYGLCPECMTQMEKIDGKCKCPKCTGVITKSEKKVIAIDLDDTIIEYDGWKGINIFGDKLEGSIEALTILREEGHKIIIDTCRLHTPELEKFLKDNLIPYDAINENPWHKYEQPGDKRKVIADVYVGDNYVHHKGDWKETLNKIREIISKKSKHKDNNKIRL